MKIGILTFHRCINYGSYWQTRCLLEELQKRGLEVVILNHQSKRIDMIEWKCALQPVLPTAVPETDRPLYRQKIMNFFDAINQLPMSPAIDLELSEQTEYYDLVIVGSDEVWNLSHPMYSNCPLFFGDGIRAERIVAYAASFGNYDASRRLPLPWAEKLHRFEKISVRDENSETIIRRALGFDPAVVLDPCLQFPFKNDYSIENSNEPYVAVYGHNFSDFFIRDLRHWADSRKLRLVSIGYRNDWADEQFLTAGPIEFASFIARAQSVITNFFHGCVFALVNIKPFVCETAPYRLNKVIDLLRRINGKKHLRTESAPEVVYSSCLEQPPGDEIYRRIDSLRESSNDFFNLALQNI